MRKTKIICTIGPACADKNTLKQMILAGMNVARFNMSHGDHASHHELIENLKKAREELNMPVAIMIDTKGPEIRIGQFQGGEVELVKNQMFSLTTRKIMGNENGVSVNLAGFPKIVKINDNVLLNDGLIKLKVEKISGEDVYCKVLVGGKLSNNKSVNIPGAKLDLQYLSETDKKDILFGINEGADIFAISFVGSKDDVVAVRKFLDKHGSRALICSKIESEQGVLNMNEIIEASDSVMVARGDLGVEIDFEKIPFVQKQIISKCAESGKISVTATEMLESMINNIRPTRAEISDIANAVHDGSSAIMLSGETSTGHNPVLSVETMAKITESAEQTIEYGGEIDFKASKSISASIGYASCELARSLEAKAIIVATKSGFSAQSVSRFRPKAQIIACTPDPVVYYQLALYWGVFPIIDKPYSNTDNLLTSSKECAIKNKLVKKGDIVVQTAGLTLENKGTNLLVATQI